MQEYQADPTPFYVILHSALRHSDVDHDNEHTAKVAEWIMLNHASLRKVCSRGEWNLLVTFYDFWHKHRKAPNRSGLESLIYAKEMPEQSIVILEDYDRFSEDLKVVGPIELLQELDHRRLAYDKWKMSRVLMNASDINVGSVPMIMRDGVPTADVTSSRASNDIVYSGPGDAMKYLSQHLSHGVLLNDAPAEGGDVNDIADDIVKRYEQIKADRTRNDLFIPTGIKVIDDHLGGFRRKEVNGILGFTGQGKTRISRMLAYNAAAHKRKVLYLPFETDADEEMDALVALHASYMHSDLRGLTKQGLERGELSTSAEKALPTVVETMKARIGKNITYIQTHSRSWPDVRTLIEQACSREAFDLVIVDYLTLLSTPGSRDDIADKTAIIQDAKRLAMTANDGRGLCFVTPIQGNRKGFDDAADAHGVWQVTGIFKYSELDKSLDTCFYLFVSDEMKALGTMTLGTCKARRADLIPATTVHIEPHSGRIHCASETRSVTPKSSPRVHEASLEELLEGCTMDIGPKNTPRPSQRVQ